MKGRKRAPPFLEREKQPFLPDMQVAPPIIGGAGAVGEVLQNREKGCKVLFKKKNRTRRNYGGFDFDNLSLKRIDLSGRFKPPGRLDYCCYPYIITRVFPVVCVVCIVFFVRVFSIGFSPNIDIINMKCLAVVIFYRICSFTA